MLTDDCLHCIFKFLDIEAKLNFRKICTFTRFYDIELQKLPSWFSDATGVKYYDIVHPDHPTVQKYFKNNVMYMRMLARDQFEDAVIFRQLYRDCDIWISKGRLVKTRTGVVDTEYLKTVMHQSEQIYNIACKQNAVWRIVCYCVKALYMPCN